MQIAGNSLAALVLALPLTNGASDNVSHAEVPSDAVTRIRKFKDAFCQTGEFLKLYYQIESTQVTYKKHKGDYETKHRQLQDYEKTIAFIGEENVKDDPGVQKHWNSLKRKTKFKLEMLQNLENNLEIWKEQMTKMGKGHKLMDRLTNEWTCLEDLDNHEVANLSLSDYAKITSCIKEMNKLLHDMDKKGICNKYFQPVRFQFYAKMREIKQIRTFIVYFTEASSQTAQTLKHLQTFLSVRESEDAQICDLTDEKKRITGGTWRLSKKSEEWKKVQEETASIRSELAALKEKQEKDFIEFIDNLQKLWKYFQTVDEKKITSLSHYDEGNQMFADVVTISEKFEDFWKNKSVNQLWRKLAIDKESVQQLHSKINKIKELLGKTARRHGDQRSSGTRHHPSRPGCSGGKGADARNRDGFGRSTTDCTGSKPGRGFKTISQDCAKTSKSKKDIPKQFKQTSKDVEKYLEKMMAELEMNKKLEEAESRRLERLEAAPSDADSEEAPEEENDWSDSGDKTDDDWGDFADES